MMRSKAIRRHVDVTLILRRTSQSGERGQTAVAVLQCLSLSSFAERSLQKQKRPAYGQGGGMPERLGEEGGGRTESTAAGDVPLIVERLLVHPRGLLCLANLQTQTRNPHSPIIHIRAMSRMCNLVSFGNLGKVWQVNCQYVTPTDSHPSCAVFGRYGRCIMPAAGTLYLRCRPGFESEAIGFRHCDCTLSIQALLCKWISFGVQRRGARLGHDGKG